MPRPRGRTRFTIPKKSHSSLTSALAAKQQCCVVCYSSFYAFPVSQTKWEACLTKVFYKALNIPPFQTGEEEGDDEVLLLPYCPDCHSKISVMFNLYSQLETLQNQYACVRNEIAFLVVETINKNCRNGPMDFIRQQIYEKWQEFYADESGKDDFKDYFGLDVLAANSQMELQEIYDSVIETNLKASDSMNEEGTEGFNTTMDEEEGDDGDEILNILESDPAALSSSSRARAKQSSAASSLSDNGYYAVNGDDNFEEGEDAYEFNEDSNEAAQTSSSKNSKYNVKMPRLIPMSASRSQKGQNSRTLTLATNSLLRGKRRPGRPLGKSRISRGIPRKQFYGNHVTENNEQEDESYTVSSAHLVGVDVKPALKALKRKAMSAPEHNATSKRAVTEKSKEQEVKASRYPTRTSGRTRRLQEKNDADTSRGAANNEEPEDTRDPLADLPEVAPNTPGIYTCTLCPKFYTTTSRLLRHESLCHPSLKSFQCLHCQKGFSSHVTYKRHMINVHPGTPFLPDSSNIVVEDDEVLQCPVCAKTFVKKSSYTIHMKSHKLKVGRPKGMILGRKKIKAVKKVKEIKEQVSKIPNGSAPSSPLKKNQLLSPEKFRSQSDSASDVGEVDDLTCRICHKAFPYRTLLNMHFITHANARKDYKCHICLSAFATYTELKFHQDEAHKNKPLPCSMCGQKFNGAESLQRHFKVHDLKQELVEPIEAEADDDLDGMLLHNDAPDEILPN